jgi:molybdenum cofactor cytidylyltransferase
LSSVAAIVLAAGMSRRMGSPKALLPIDGKPMLACVLDALAAAGEVSPIVVITGAAAEQLRPILADRDVQAAHNPDYERGEMLSSIKVGLVALPRNIDATLIVLCDQPGVKSSTVAALAAGWSQLRPRVLAPTYQGKRGHPIVLSMTGVDEIISLPPAATLKSYTSAYASEMVELSVDDAAVVRDIDTPGDYAAELKRS